MQGGISVLKAVDRYLRKFRLKSGANQVDLGKAAETAVDLYEHCTLVLFNGSVQVRFINTVFTLLGPRPVPSAPRQP